MSARMRPRGALSGRLGTDDWVAAALAVMAEDGIGGVKIHRLCERLGVTKGSFYWHFEDVDALLAELVSRWRSAAEQSQAPRVATDTKQDLLAAVRLFADPRSRRLARAMRDWARTDARARAAVRAGDDAVFANLVRAFCELGFDHADADMRAKVLFYAGVGFEDVGPIGDRRSPERQLSALIDLLTHNETGG